VNSGFKAAPEAGPQGMPRVGKSIRKNENLPVVDVVGIGTR
jgi:hypothetical protein